MIRKRRSGGVKEGKEEMAEDEKMRREGEETKGRGGKDGLEFMASLLLV